MGQIDMELTREFAIDVFDGKIPDFNLILTEMIQSRPGCDLIQCIYFNRNIKKYYRILYENDWGSDKRLIISMDEVEQKQEITYKYIVKK